jgi:hypothetical protein
MPQYGRNPTLGRVARRIPYPFGQLAFARVLISAGQPIWIESDHFE